MGYLNIPSGACAVVWFVSEFACHRYQGQILSTGCSYSLAQTRSSMKLISVVGLLDFNTPLQLQGNRKCKHSIIELNYHIFIYGSNHTCLRAKVEPSLTVDS